MSGKIDPTDPTVMVEEMQLTAAELERRGQRMLKLSRELLAQAMHHETIAALPEERSVGRLGVVSEPEAIKAARELGEMFTRNQFAEKLGLKAPGASRWLTKLMNHSPRPIVQRHPDGSYGYIPPPSNGSGSRERIPAPEEQLVDRDILPQRGAAIRVPAAKRHAQELSKPGTGHRVRRIDREYERNEAVRREREAQRNGKSH